MPTRCWRMRRRPRRTISWCREWWNKMCMACEEMDLFYAYLDAVEEAKRKAQPWQSELTALSIANARDGLKQKKFSAAELADAHLAAMEKARSLNAYVLETPERASAMAKAADARIAAGHAGQLDG